MAATAKVTKMETGDSAVLTLIAGDLRAAVKSVAAAVESRNTVPILADVLIEVGGGAGGGRVSVTGTDLDVRITRSFAVEGGFGAPFALCVPARLLAALLDKCDAAAELHLVREPGKLLLRTGRSRFTLSTLPADDFPVMADGDWPVQFEMAGAQLSAMIGRVKGAVSTEETRYYLCGAAVDVGADDNSGGVPALRLVATDGHRLHVARRDLPEGAGAIGDLGCGMPIIPRKTLGLIDALCGEKRIDVALSAGKIRVESGDTLLVSKLIDGTFPDYRRVIPAVNDKTLHFDPSAFSAAIERVVTLSSEKIQAVRCDLEEGKAVLSVVSPENGTATEDVPCRFEGEPLTIGLNAKYWLAVLAQLSHSDSACATFSDSAGPTLWSSDGADSVDRFVLMPMRV